MHKPTLAGLPLVRVLVATASALLLAACAGDVTSPPAVAPSTAEKALIGTPDGTYTFTVQPGISQKLAFGSGYLDVPADAICSLANAGYGPSLWNAPCDSETGAVVITATVSGAQTASPRVDFSPALRFNPNANVSLTLFVDRTSLNTLSVVKYCTDGGGCIDESIADPSVSTSSKKVGGGGGFQLSRRVKHFSGYMVSE